MTLSLMIFTWVFLSLCFVYRYLKSFSLSVILYCVVSCIVLEYVDGKWAYDDSGPPGALGEITARKYLRDVVAGLMYLHAHNVIHGDIKPDNLLVTSTGRVKIGDFSVSQVFKDDDDQLRRSPGTPVFTAPECCLGITYSGRSADTWAVGVTLYCMILGQYPFLGDTLQDTYDKVPLLSRSTDLFIERHLSRNNLNNAISSCFIFYQHRRLFTTR
jgi:serine/threonine protein kinase